MYSRNRAARLHYREDRHLENIASNDIEVDSRPGPWSGLIFRLLAPGLIHNCRLPVDRIWLRFEPVHFRRKLNFVSSTT